MDFSTNQSINNNGEKTKKILKISIIFCVILLLIVLGLYAFVYLEDSKSLKLYVDSKKIEYAEDTFIFDDNNKIYVNIEEFARKVNYEYYQGEYKKYSEETSKCYVANKNEIAGFELGSNRLYKINLTGDVENYEWYELEEPVKQLNGKLYCLSNAISTAFNVKFTFNAEKNRVQVSTLDRLFTYYQELIVNNIGTYGYNNLDEKFTNKKAILYNMLVVKKAETDSSGKEIKDTYKYGVVSLNLENIIGVKYDNLEFIEATKEFYATSNAKVGILSNVGAQIISLQYDDIELIDNDLRLYYVKNGMYSGVLDKSGKTIAHLEYTTIGVDTKIFSRENITNNKVLYDNCIPVSKNNKWGLIGINGIVILPVEYDALGYIAGTRKEVAENNLLLIPEYEGIVVCKEGKYGIITSTGKPIAPCSFDKIYSITNLGEDTYYLTYTVAEEVNGTIKETSQTISLPDYIKYVNTQINEADETNTRTAE